MQKVKRLWMPLLLGTLLMATLVGVAGARPNARPEASPALQDWMINHAHCVPRTDDEDYHVDDDYLACDSAASGCGFQCPIKPPHQGLIRVQRLAMYAYDNGTGHVCIWLTQSYPKNGINNHIDRIANQCTSDSLTDPFVYAYNPANFKVSVLQDLYVWVNFGANSTTQNLYGFKLKYEPL